MFVEVLDALGSDADFDVVHVVFRGDGAGRVADDIRRLFADDTARGILVGRDDGILVPRLVNLHRITVEIWVRKEGGRPPEVHDGEEEFVVVLPDPCAAPDDLLELRHRGDSLVEHDEPAGLGIDSGGHELGCAGDDGIGLLGVDEVVELRLALVVVAGNSHHVFAVGGGKVGVGVHHRLPHPFGVLDVFAEDDGLGEAVGSFQELRDLGGNHRGAPFKDEVPVKVAVVVFPVLDELAELVPLAGFGPPAVEVLVEADANDFVGGEKPVGDALLQRVGVNRLAEVFDIGNILGFLRRRGEADLGGRGVVFEDLALGGILVGAAAVALVHGNEIEEVRRELLVNVLRFLGARNGLVEAQVNLEGLVHRAIRDFGHRRAKGLEVVGLGLIGEDVAIDEEEDALLRLRFPKPPDDLKAV